MSRDKWRIRQHHPRQIRKVVNAATDINRRVRIDVAQQVLVSPKDHCEHVRSQIGQREARYRHHHTGKIGRDRRRHRQQRGQTSACRREDQECRNRQKKRGSQLWAEQISKRRKMMALIKVDPEKRQFEQHTQEQCAPRCPQNAYYFTRSVSAHIQKLPETPQEHDRRGQQKQLVR